MTESNLGRRYERLLFLAAPLSFASILVLFIAIALTTQQERAKARCYESAAAILSVNQKELEIAWGKTNLPNKSPYAGAGYRLEGARTLVDGLSYECYVLMKSEFDGRFRNAPLAVIQELKNEARELSSKPVRLYGVEIPEKATVNLLGTTVKIELGALMGMFQVVLGPLLILWLGSIYNTRYRESQLICRATAISEIFPHLINIYPVGRLPEARKKSWTIYYFPIVVGLFYSLVRVILLSIFIFPPAGSYIASLIVFPPEHFIGVFIMFGFLICMNSLAVLISEFLPWHFKKVFPRVDQSH